MKLYYRLNGKDKIALINHSKNFPQTTKPLLKQIKKSDTLNEIPLGVAVSVFRILFPLQNFDIFKLYKTFNI